MRFRLYLLPLSLLCQSAIATPSAVYEGEVQRGPIVARRSRHADPNGRAADLQKAEPPPFGIFVPRDHLTEDHRPSEAVRTYHGRSLDEEHDANTEDVVEKRLGHHMIGFTKSRFRRGRGGSAFNSLKSHGHSFKRRIGRKIDGRVARKATRASGVSSLFRRSGLQQDGDQYWHTVEARGGGDSNEDGLNARDLPKTLGYSNAAPLPISLHRREPLYATEYDDFDSLQSRHGGGHGGHAHYWHLPDSRRTKVKKIGLTTLALSTLGGLMTYGIIKKIKHKKAEKEKEKAEKNKGQPPAQPPAPSPPVGGKP